MSVQTTKTTIKQIEDLIKDLPVLPFKVGHWSGKILTVIGYLELTQRGIFKSTIGDGSNHQVVDKQEVDGELRAELRGIKVLTKMRDTMLMDLRDVYETLDDKQKEQISWSLSCRKNEWLCGNCVACVSFGSLKAGKFARRSRWFFPDMFSETKVEDCVAGYQDFDEAGVLNTVEGPTREGMRSRSSASFATYEYVRAGTRFPFKFSVRDPSKFDLFAFIKTINEVGQVDGIGAYSSRNGRFKVVISAIADGAPLNNASNLDLARHWERLSDPEALIEPEATVVKIAEDENTDIVGYAYEQYYSILKKANWTEFIVSRSTAEGEEE